MVGGVRCTCDAWAMQFFEALAGNGPTPARVDSRDHQEAEAELAAEGF
jgi:hypothetical protein